MYVCRTMYLYGFKIIKMILYYFLFVPAFMQGGETKVEIRNKGDSVNEYKFPGLYRGILNILKTNPNLRHHVLFTLFITNSPIMCIYHMLYRDNTQFTNDII